jgi:hypothetical protein
VLSLGSQRVKEYRKRRIDCGTVQNKLLVVKITGNNIVDDLYRLAGDVRCRNGRGKANGDNDDVNSQDKLRKSKRIKQMEGTE